MRGLLSGKPRDYRSGRSQRPFDYSQAFQLGDGCPPLGDNLLAFSIVENVVRSCEVTSDGSLNGQFESLSWQFFVLATGLNDYDGSLPAIVANESDLSGGS